MSSNNIPLLNLPVCRLCGEHPYESCNGYAYCKTPTCRLYWRNLAVSEWRTLMAPPVVTDEMVARGATVLMGTWPWTARDISRAVLEAAMKE